MSDGVTQKSEMIGTALVTGGSRGIGRATCLRLAKDCYVVAVGYSHNAEHAEAVVRQIRDEGGKAEAFRVDLSDFSTIEAFFDDVETKLGPVC